MNLFDLGVVWLGSSFAVVVANAFDAAWRVAGRGWRDRVRGLGGLLGTGVLVVGALGATSLWATLPAALAPLVLLISLAENALVWMWTSWVLPNRPFIGWRAILVPELDLSRDESFGGGRRELRLFPHGRLRHRSLDRSQTLDLFVGGDWFRASGTSEPQLRGCVPLCPVERGRPARVTSATLHLPVAIACAACETWIR